MCKYFPKFINNIDPVLQSVSIACLLRVVQEVRVLFHVHQECGL